MLAVLRLKVGAPDTVILAGIDYAVGVFAGIDYAISVLAKIDYAVGGNGLGSFLLESVKVFLL